MNWALGRLRRWLSTVRAAAVRWAISGPESATSLCSFPLYVRGSRSGIPSDLHQPFQPATPPRAASLNSGIWSGPRAYVRHPPRLSFLCSEAVAVGIMEGPSDDQVTLGPQDSYLNSSTASADTTSSSSQHVAKLQKLLYRRMLIGVNDGRYFLGLFQCIDKQGNIILQDSVEYRSARHSSSLPMEQRCLGLILIPAACRSSCHADCFIEEQMSLLSLGT